MKLKILFLFAGLLIAVHAQCQTGDDSLQVISKNIENIKSQQKDYQSTTTDLKAQEKQAKELEKANKKQAKESRRLAKERKKAIKAADNTAKANKRALKAQKKAEKNECADEIINQGE